MRRPSWRVLSPALLIALFPISIASANADKELGKLDCVGIMVEDLSSDAAEAGLSKELLSNALLVAVKSKAPRLGVDSSCSPFVYCRVTLAILKGEKGSDLGFACYLELVVRREAYIRIIDHSKVVTVWEKGRLLFGPADRAKAKATVLERLDDLVTEFAAAYYKAGNP